MNPLWLARLAPFKALVPYVIGAVVLAAAIGGVLWYGSSQREAGRAECEAAHTLAELQAYRKEMDKLSGVSTLLEGAAQTLARAKPTVIERYTRVETQAPLPPGCVRDAARVRSTVDAINEANAARKHGGTVP